MGFIGILIQLTLVAVVLFELTAAAVAFPIALPDCPDRCGDVEIPYPFGLREGCYIDRNFYVNCTTNSFGKTQPVIPEDFNITNISLQGQIDMSMYVAHDCYVQGVLKTCQRWCEEMASRLLKASRRCIPTWRRSMIFASGSRVMRKQPWPRRCKEVLDRGLTNGSSCSYPASNSTSRPILRLGQIWLRAAGVASK